MCHNLLRTLCRAARNRAEELYYRGVCILHFHMEDTSDLASACCNAAVLRTPDLTSTAMTSTLQLPLSDSGFPSLGSVLCLLQYSVVRVCGAHTPLSCVQQGLGGCPCLSH